MQQQLIYRRVLKLLKEKIEQKERISSVLGPNGVEPFAWLAFEMGQAIIKLRRETHWDAEVMKQLDVDLEEAVPGTISLSKLYQLSNFYLGIERMARCLNWSNKIEKDKICAKEDPKKFESFCPEGGKSC